MAKRPIFIPNSDSFPFVREMLINFEWHSGLAKVQAQKSIASLHEAAAKQKISPILEISSKSANYLGVSLSAFNLMLEVRGKKLGTELEFVIMVIAVSCVKLLSAHNSTQHTSRKHKV
jgi:hypothetical protein